MTADERANEPLLSLARQMLRQEFNIAHVTAHVNPDLVETRRRHA